MASCLSGCSLRRWGWAPAGKISLTMTIGSAVLSPDGRWIVFDGAYEGNSDIWVVSTRTR